MTRPAPKQVAYLIVAAVLVAGLFHLGSQSFAAGLIPPPWDKLAHFALFSALTMLLWFGTAARWPVAVFVLVAGIGVLDELHQASLPGRTADAIDLFVDFAAAGATCTLLSLRARLKAGT